MTLTKGTHTLSAILLSQLPSETQLSTLENLVRLQYSPPMINCIWKHSAQHDPRAFAAIIASVTARPPPCTQGCLWSEPKKDESAIFGPICKASYRECALADCDRPAQYYCSRCYSVRYCTAMCQRHDWDEHKKQCRALVQAVTLLARRGEAYARREIKNNISISDPAWQRLWARVTSLLKSEAETLPVSAATPVQAQDPIDEGQTDLSTSV